MKKIVLLFFVLTILFIFTGCGTDGISIKTEDGTVKLSGDKVEFNSPDGESVEIKSDGETVEVQSEDGTMTITESGTNISDDNTEGSFSYGGGLPLPEGFPVNIVPIVDDANIFLAWENVADNIIEFSVTYKTKKDIEEVYEFYLKALNAAEDKETAKLNDKYLMFGIIDNIEINIGLMIDDLDGEQKTFVNIDLQTYPE